MTIEKKQYKRKVIDLDGPDGNAFCLFAYARNLSSQLGIDADKIIDEMMEGDYEHLLEVFDDNFGTFVTLETSQKNLLKRLEGRTRNIPNWRMMGK